MNPVRSSWHKNFTEIFMQGTNEDKSNQLPFIDMTRSNIKSRLLTG